MAERRGGRAHVDPLAVLAAIAEQGSIRSAASFLGLPKSTVYGISKGAAPSAKTADTITSTVGDALTALVQGVGSLIESLAGGRASERPAVAKRLAAEQRQSPGTVQEQTNAFQQIMGALGLNADGTTAPPPPPADVPPAGPELDALGRRINPAQRANYESLKAQWEAGTLTAENYGRLRDYQLGAEGGLFDDVEPLP